MNDKKRDAPSYHRNIEVITNQLRIILPKNTKYVLEIGSGTGQHVAHFASEFPDIVFQPTDYKVENLESIDAWAADQKNILSAQRLDITKTDWLADSTRKFDALLCFNVIHITPWEVTKAIFIGADKIMNKDCKIAIYGPFKINGTQTSQSNEEFEKWLKGRDSAYGVRDIEDVNKAAQAYGFSHIEKHPMPANNFINVFART